MNQNLECISFVCMCVYMRSKHICLRTSVQGRMGDFVCGYSACVFVCMCRCSCVRMWCAWFVLCAYLRFAWVGVCMRVCVCSCMFFVFVCLCAYVFMGQIYTPLCLQKSEEFHPQVFHLDSECLIGQIGKTLRYHPCSAPAR